MNQDRINNIGFRQSKRKDARIADVRNVPGLSKILDQDFESWSDFDSWGQRNCQQFIFANAMHVAKGKKVDIVCGCCEYVKETPIDIKVKKAGKDCYGVKTAYMMEKILLEIEEFKARQGNDGTYSA
tara:strand:- start:29 stop:409 length:381 start_codon:yes stop_codon:yes gene_type:complete